MHRMNLVACDNKKNLSELCYENMSKTTPFKIVECKDVSFISITLKILIRI